MATRQKPSTLPGPPPSAHLTIWETGGITEHMGGLSATEQLARLYPLAPEERVLDLGCGTGYSACYLAQRHGVQVVGLDLNASLIARAQQRLAQLDSGARVLLLRADGHMLPFPDASFDQVLVESVLIFCDARQVMAEIQRVLRAGGSCGVNELTLLQPAPASFLRFLKNVGVAPRLADDWQRLFEEAGFVDVQRHLHPLSLWQQFQSHLQVNGVWAYGRAVIRGLAAPTIRRLFFNREVLAAARQYRAYLGYGLYVARKPQ